MRTASIVRSLRAPRRFHSAKPRDRGGYHRSADRMCVNRPTDRRQMRKPTTSVRSTKADFKQTQRHLLLACWSWPRGLGSGCGLATRKGPCRDRLRKRCWRAEAQTNKPKSPLGTQPPVAQARNHPRAHNPPPARCHRDAPQQTRLANLPRACAARTRARKHKDTQASPHSFMLRSEAVRVR